MIILYNIIEYCIILIFVYFILDYITVYCDEDFYIGVCICVDMYECVCMYVYVCIDTYNVNA